jgi:glycosyltransferase involved in cell wall biosynthesis
MYIWVCGRAVPSQYNGMHGSFEFEQAQMIKKKGYKVVYIALSIFPRTVLKWKDLGLHKAVIDGIVTYNVYLPFGFTGFGRQGMRDLAAKTLFSLAIRENGKPDIIHVHFPSMWSPRVFERLKAEGIGIVATEHWTEVLKKNINKYMTENLRWFVNNSKSFICVGEPLKQSVIDLVHTGGDVCEKIKVIPNIVNESFSFQKSKVDFNHFVFCAVGRLVECKRFDLLIQAFSEVFRDNKHVYLKIIGGGNQMKELQSLVHRLHMEEQIILTGIKTRSETAAEIQKCDVLVCSSNLETFGVPVIEGMACGKPIITTDAFAMPSVIDRSVGLVVEKNNSEQMKSALVKMYETREQYDEALIANTAKSYFSGDTVINNLIKIYES